MFYNSTKIYIGIVSNLEYFSINLKCIINLIK